MEHKKSEKIMENIVKTIAVDEKLSLFLFVWIYQVPKEREKREKIVIVISTLRKENFIFKTCWHRWKCIPAYK